MTFWRMWRSLWILIIVAIGMAACQAGGSASTVAGDEFTGFVEGKELDIAVQVSGRIATISVAEGDVIPAGKRLATIEDDLIQSRLAVANANIAAAQAQLALLQAGARPEDVRRSQALVDKAQAGVEAANEALDDVQAIRANPQMLVIARAQAELRAQMAAEQAIAVQRQADAADQMNEYWEKQTRSLWEGVNATTPDGSRIHVDIPMKQQTYSQEQWQKAGNAAWQAWAGVAQAQANTAAAEAGKKNAADQLANPIALDARANQARSALDRAAAALESADAAQRVVTDRPSPARIKVAEAAVDEARAARATIERELAQYVITAPVAGMASRVFFRTGEVVTTGSPVVRLTVEGDLTLRVHVPMSVLPQVQLGKPVVLKVEGIGGRTFAGQVTRIGDQAEFSGRQSQTDSDRNAQLVVVEISVDATDGTVKSGMPATVTFR